MKKLDSPLCTEKDQYESEKAKDNTNIVEGDLDRIAKLTVEKDIANPKAVTEQAVREIINDAYFGAAPRKYPA